MCLSICSVTTSVSSGVVVLPSHVIFAALKAVARLACAISTAIHVDTFLHKVETDSPRT